jgi:hypothetical protein
LKKLITDFVRFGNQQIELPTVNCSMLFTGENSTGGYFRTEEGAGVVLLAGRMKISFSANQTL